MELKPVAATTQELMALVREPKLLCAALGISPADLNQWIVNQAEGNSTMELCMMLAALLGAEAVKDDLLV